MNINIIENEVINGKLISHAEVQELLKNTSTEELCATANRIREHFMGNKIDTCSIMNARSGRCSEDCKWCSQSKYHKSKVDIYPLVSKAEAMEHAMNNASKGIGRFSLVTSGRTMSDSEIDKVVEIYGDIAKECDMKLCASMGLLGKDQLQKLQQVGVVHYHCNMETAPSYFPELCTTHTWQEKVQTIEWAKQVGLKICSGGIIGMGESMDQRVEMALFLRDLGVDSIPINILNPIAGTTLEGTEPLSDDDILRTFAMFRIVNPKAMIRFAGGRTQILHIQEKALLSGVSGTLMGDLLTTIGASTDEDKAMFERLGFKM